MVDVGAVDVTYLSHSTTLLVRTYTGFHHPGWESSCRSAIGVARRRIEAQAQTGLVWNEEGDEAIPWVRVTKVILGEECPYLVPAKPYGVPW